MGKLIVLALIIVVFSGLTVFEVLLLQAAGFNIVSHLATSYDKDGVQFFFESAGVIAFVLAQPMILFVLLVWAASKLNLGAHLSAVWQSMWSPLFSNP